MYASCRRGDPARFKPAGPSELEDGPFAAGPQFQVGRVPDGLLRQLIERFVVVGRVVVERHEPTDPGEPGERRRVLERVVAPADAALVLGARVLGVVEEHVDAVGQRPA